MTELCFALCSKGWKVKAHKQRLSTVKRPCLQWKLLERLRDNISSETIQISNTRWIYLKFAGDKKKNLTTWHKGSKFKSNTKPKTYRQNENTGGMNVKVVDLSSHENHQDQQTVGSCRRFYSSQWDTEPWNLQLFHWETPGQTLQWLSSVHEKYI